MKRNVLPFLAGAATSALALSLTVGAYAAATGAFSANTVDLSILGQEVCAEDTFTGENGQQIPSSITYTDAAGGATTYVSLRALAQLVDAPIFWDSEDQMVRFGEGYGKGDVEIVTGTDPEPNNLPKEPELGVKHGGFTEVAPRSDDEIYKPFVILEDTSFSSLTGFIKQRYEIFPSYGRYVEFTVTNEGQEPVEMHVSRPNYVALGVPVVEVFTTISIDPGETVTRAFEMDEGIEFPHNYLRLDVFDIHDNTPTKTTELTVNVTQYQTVDK